MEDLPVSLPHFGGNVCVLPPADTHMGTGEGETPFPMNKGIAVGDRSVGQKTQERALNLFGNQIQKYSGA